MNNKEQSMRQFALVLYNLLTPTVYTYDADFLNKVSDFIQNAGFEEQYKNILKKMLKNAFQNTNSYIDKSK